MYNYVYLCINGEALCIIGKTLCYFQANFWSVVQNIQMRFFLISMATMDYYSIYGALLQTPVEGPGFADVYLTQELDRVRAIFRLLVQLQMVLIFLLVILPWLIYH